MTDMNGETGKADAPKRKRAPRKRKVADVSDDTQSVQAESVSHDDGVSHDDQVMQAADVSDDGQVNTAADLLSLGKAIAKGRAKSGKGGKQTRLTLNVDPVTYAKFRMMAFALEEENGPVFKRAVDSLERELMNEIARSGGDDDNASSG